jgi:hypothetical protein
MSMLNHEIEKISNEWRILENQWNSTCQHWNDSMRQRFEREFWQEFERLVPAYLRKLEETDQFISKVYRELEF